MALAIVLFTILQLLPAKALIWRYYGGSMGTDQLPMYKNSVLLECVGCSVNEFSWISNSCQIIETSHTSLIGVVCSGPGIHQISVEGPSQNSTSILNVPLTSSPHCYTWKTETEFTTENSTRQVVVFSVWIEHTNSSASQREALTYQFYSLGESPWLVSVTPSVKLNITAHDFDTERSVWEFVVEVGETLPSEVLIEVAYSGVQVMDCGISPHRFPVVTRRLNNSLLSTSTESVFTDSTLKLTQDSSALATSVLLNGGSGCITQDDFATLIVVGVSGEISDAVFTSNTLCLLIAGDIHCLPYDDSHIISHTVGSIPGAKQLAGRAIQVAGETYDIVVVWSESAEEILVSEDGGTSFSSLNLPSAPEAVHSVNVHPFKRSIAVLTTPSNSLAQFVQCNVGIWSCSENAFSFTYTGGNLSAVYGADGFGDMFIWSHTELFYSPNGGVTVIALSVNVQSEDSGLLNSVQWNSGEYIKQTASGRGGKFAVLSSSNRLFYGTLSSGSAIEIASGTLPDSEAVIYFNSLGQLRIITIENSDVAVYTVPTYSLVLDSLYPPPACPFTQWSHTQQENVFYLDKRENLTLWASVTPAQWKGNEISFVVSDPGSIESSSDSVELQTAVVGVVQRNTTVTITPSRSLDTTARTAVKLSAAVQNLACPTSAELVSMIAMECPPGRHIRVKDSPRKCSSYANHTYTIPKNNYDSTFRGGRSSSDKRVEYDVEMYGCPIAIPYTERFRPTLELYDGDDLLEEVNADFVVWEVHGRHDYSYTATATKAKCQQTPQTWDDMLVNGTPPSAAWTPETYRPCFEGVGELNGNTRYQILNSTGVSSLKWLEINGMYVFAATVVARDYSFCRLTIHFAVRVYGASGAAILGYILLVMTCLIGVGILVFSYYVYKQRPKLVQ